MTDTIDTSTESATEAEEHHGPTDALFVKVFVALAAITALEVALSYADVGAFFLPALLALMVIKFFTVVLVFMHIKYDHKVLGRLFYVGLGMAIAVYGATLSTFQFFAG